MILDRCHFKHGKTPRGHQDSSDLVVPLWEVRIVDELGIPVYRRAHRVANLRGALAVVLVNADAPELRLVYTWLDSWSGIGLIIVGMSHQGSTVSLGEHGVGQWIAVFFHGRGDQEPVAPAGMAQEPTPRGAVQRAAWQALGAVGHEDHRQDHLPESTVVEPPPYASHRIEVVMAA